MGSTNIQIAVKVRPLIERELKDHVKPAWLVKDNSIVHITSDEHIVGEPYTFDHIFGQETSNEYVYGAVVKPLVMSCLEGINSTIFAYGQTSSGKTHTMLGDKDVPGIVVYTIKDIFKHIEETPEKNFLLRCSYLEIYNEKINDLLDTNAKDIKIREDYDQIVHVPAKEEVIRESTELFSIMKRGMKTRKIGCTDMNERSSRSHTIFKLVIQSQNKDSDGSYTESSLSLVDLAGSERVGQMKITGERQAEGVSINKSLTTLGLVIRKLSEGEPFINYRDSKLTRLLQHSLGGNSKTLIICTVTVAAAEETKSTLEFAQRAKYVKNRPIINEKVTDKDQLKQYAHLCQLYKYQIEKLRTEKLEKDKTINALEDKISNIKLFTSTSIDQKSKGSKIPQRRHTLGYYKPIIIKPLVPGLESEVIHEYEEYNPDTRSPVKSDKPCTVTSEGDMINATLDIPQTSTTIPPNMSTQCELLDESFDSLRLFTSDEKELSDQYGQIREQLELIERLRNENIELKKIPSTQLNLEFVKINKYLLDGLYRVASVLEKKPEEEVRSLHPIAEDNVEMEGKQLDSASYIELSNQLSEVRKTTDETNKKYDTAVKENQLLQNQLKDQEKIISNLTTSSSKEINKMEAEYTALATENQQLKTQLETNTFQVSELETSLSEHNIKDNATPQNKFYILRKEIDELKLITKHDALKIAELEEENQRFKTELLNLMKSKTSEKANLRQALADQESQLNELKSKLIEQNDSKELTELKGELERLTQVEVEYTTVIRHIQDEHLDIVENANTLKAFKTDNESLKSKLESSEQAAKILEEDNNRLKVELEDVMFQLNGEQKEVENLGQQLDEKSLELSSLKENICQLNQELNLLKLDTKNVQELTNNNITLRETIIKNEEEIVELTNQCSIKEYQGNILKNDNSRLKSDLQHVLSQLCEKENYILNICQELKDQSSLNARLEQEILDMRECINKSKIQIEQFQDISIDNASLRSDLFKKEDEIIRISNEKDVEIRNLMQKLKAQEELRTITEIKKVSNGANRLQDLEQTVKENSEIKEDNLILEERLANHTEEIKTLKEKCSTLEHELEKALKQLNSTLQELDRQTESYNDLETKCAIQGSQIKNYKEQLISKIAELDDKSNLYNNILTAYADKNVEIESLKAENEDFRNQLNQPSQNQIEVSDLQKSLTKIKEELRKQLDSNSNLQNDLDQCYLKINNLKSQLDIKNEELNEHTNEISNLKSHVVALELSMQQEIESRENENLYLKQQVDQLRHDNVDIGLQLTKKSEEVKQTEKEKVTLAERIALMSNDLLEIKRSLDRRNEEFSHLMGKYNALEVELDTCQDLLKACNQKLKKQENTEYLVEISKHGKEVLIMKIAQLQSEVEYLSLGLKEMQKECKFKTEQLKSAYEEIEILRQINKDVESLEPKLKEYKLNLKKVHDSDRDSILLKNKIVNLTNEILRLEKMLANSVDKTTSFKPVLNTGDQRIVNQNQLKEELYACKALVEALESQVKVKKTNVDHLTQKLQICETEIKNLQEKVNDLVEYKQKMQEKIANGTLKEVPLSKLSDEGRPSSDNNNLRRIKRRSIHDQRRGLVLESSDSADIDCSNCKELSSKLTESEKEIIVLQTELIFSNKENKDMSKMIKELEQRETELHNRLHSSELPGDSSENKLLKLEVKNDDKAVTNKTDCSDCKKLRSKVAEIECQNKTLEKEVERLKADNIFLDKENDDMLKIIKDLEQSETELHNQILSLKLPGTSRDELCKLQVKYDEVVAKKTELEEEVNKNKKIVSKCKNLLEIEASREKRKLDDERNQPKTLPIMEDKETQATCDLLEKYTIVKKLAQIRRQEGNYLRAKLNLPPDCAVLPGDIQRNTTNVTK